MKKSVILCADDFSESEAISHGILRLLEAGRLSAVSCMTESPRWDQDAASLMPYLEQADIGLHFNLTHSFGQATWPLSRLMQSSLLRTLDVKPIRAGLHRQLELFEHGMNRPPDFVDGHQHVHVFPGIRNVVYNVLADRYPDKRPYLRSVSPAIRNHDAPVKAAVLRLLAWNADKEAESAGFRTPNGFAGLYSLSPAADYAHYMRRWLASAQHGMLVMCHPALQDDDITYDPIAPARVAEMTYFLSDAFADDLAAADVRLSRLSAVQDFRRLG